MLKVATIILLIVLIFGGAYSLMCVFAPKIILSSGFEITTGEILEDISKNSYLKVMINEMMHKGALGLATVVSCIFILIAAFRKAEKWAWWAMLVIGVIAWGYGFVENIITGDMRNSLLHLVGLVIYFVGLLLPVKAFFAKKT